MVLIHGNAREPRGVLRDGPPMYGRSGRAQTGGGLQPGSGVTTGSFYHYRQLAATAANSSFWAQDRTVRIAQAFSAVSDPEGTDAGDHPGGAVMPHGAEAAIRA